MQQYGWNAKTGMVRFTSAAMAAVGLTAIAIAATGVLQSTQVVESGYSRSFGDVAASWSTSSDSKLWLSSNTTDHPKAHLRLSVGDRVHIAGADGRLVGVQVTAVNVIEGHGAELTGTRFQLVTGNRLDAEGDASSAPVRFLFEIDDGEPTPRAVAHDKVL